MKSLILATLDNLMEVLSNPNVIIGIILLALGLAFLLLAKRVTMAIRKKNEIANNDNIYLTILALSLVLILIGFIISIFR